MKIKIFKISLLYLIISFFIGVIVSAFIFGINVGTYRIKPYFDYAYKLREIFYNLKLEANKIVKGNYEFTVNNSNINLEMELEGKLPKNKVLAISLSKFKKNKIIHYLFFIHQKKIIHSLILNEKEDFDIRHPSRKNPHGLIISDSEIYYNFDPISSISKIDYCGKILWSKKGNYHHLMSANEDYIWALSQHTSNNFDVATNFEKISKLNGKTIQMFNMKDIIIANFPNDYFTSKQKGLTNVWEKDPFHFNDVDVLSKKNSNYFSNFTEGDLLISSRSLNLVFIISPVNLKVKQMFYGIARRQHDPDWNEGFISLFDNQTSFNGKRYFNSRILNIHFGQEKHFVKEYLTDTQFMTEIRGTHEFSEDNGNTFLLVTSSDEGKVYLFKNSKKIFTFLNRNNKDIMKVFNSKLINEKNFFSNISKCN